MAESSEFTLAEIGRKLANLIIPGIVHDVDATTARARVRSGNMVTGWLPWLTVRAGSDRSWWAPDEEEQVLLLCPEGDTAQAWILPSSYTERYQQPTIDNHKAAVFFSDGSMVEYDKKNHVLNISLARGAKTFIQSSGAVHVKGDLHVTGNIHATGDITDKVRSMAGDRQIYNAHNHGGKVPAPSGKQ